MESSWIEPLRGRGGSRQSEASKRSQHALAEAAGLAALRSAEVLLALQKPDGFWCGELLADTTLESDYILLQLWLHPPKDGVWRPPTRERILKASRSILD
ncbi:MAG: squalene--hopene cyclase, partial [Candidatus Rokuibacteriota bacterium]